MSAAAFYDIALANIIRYPLSEPTDIYKLCHQAALGSEHAVENVRMARAWLDRELDEFAQEPSSLIEEAVVETITPGDQIVRVNLRPFLDVGGSPEKLFQAFLLTAKRKWGASSLLLHYWESFVQLAELGETPLQSGLLNSFMIEMAANGFPAVHHSQTYSQAYQPSYRVIAGEYLPAILPV